MKEVFLGKEELDPCSPFRMVLGEMNALYVEKNRRYKNSFANTYEKYGIVSGALRLDDKLSRLSYLIANQQDNGGDESIEDTLIDIANYAVMTLVEYRKHKNGRLTEVSAND